MHFTASLAGLLSLAAIIPSAASNSVWVRSLAEEPIEALVSTFDTGSGNTDWFTLPANYDDPSESLWNRTGWELIAFIGDQNDENSRVGFYYDFAAAETFVTFYTFDNVTFSDANPETDSVGRRDLSCFQRLRRMITMD